MMMLSCEKFTNDPNTERENDSIENIDTIPKIDSCFGDTCYTCNLGAEALLIYNELMEAFNTSCVSCLETILKDWYREYSPDESIPDSLQVVYDVYKEFFSPWDLARICNSEFGNDIYENNDYYVIQNSISYDFAFRDSPKNTYSINDFKPTIVNDDKKTLYLTGKYESAIHCFLGGNYIPTCDSTIVTPDFSSEDAYDRYVFMNEYLKFIHDHWVTAWHLETHPMVERISFNGEKDSAIVFFRVAYEGGEAVLGLEEEEWTIVDHYMTWIE